MKSWPLVRIAIPPRTSMEAWETVCALMLEYGSQGYEEGPPGPEGVPREAVFTFPALDSDAQDGSRELELARELLSAVPGGDAFGAEVRVVGEQDWGASWKPWYHRTMVHGGLYVGPPGERDLPRDPGSLYIAIDYNQAFGTGGHPTTRASLLLLEKHVPKGGVVFDVGAGTGVLSIAAIKMGARRVVATECEAVAVVNARENAELNGVGESIAVVESRVIDDALPLLRQSGENAPHLIVCNMLSHHAMPLLGSLSALGKPMVLSGFLDSESEDLEPALNGHGWRTEERIVLEEWGAWYCVRG